MRFLLTILSLLLLLALSRCGPPAQLATETPSLAAATAVLRIEVEPRGASVYVNGLRSGATPVSLTLPVGQHTIRIEQDGYEPLVETINLAADADSLLGGELTPLPGALVPTVTLKPSALPEAVQPLPDLAIRQVRIELESGGSCDYASTQLGIRVWIENVGDVAAGPFVVEVNGAQHVFPDGLAPGETVSWWFAGHPGEGETTVLVDPTHQVQESDEDNNTLFQRLPIPTLPPPCTPPPEAPSTSTPPPPQPSATPSPPLPQAVTMREGQVTIPTYPFSAYTRPAWSEAFNMSYDVLDRSAYDASGPGPSDVAYRTFVVENEYLKLVFLPDVGGRLYEVVYKPTGHRVTYRNPVLKPSPWGPPEQGWWLAAGGFEWCLPVEEHGYEWNVPWKLSASGDGQKVIVTLRDSSADDRVRAEIAVSLEAGAGFFTIRPRLENPTASPQAVKYWTNALLAPGGQNAPSADLRFVLPDPVTAVTVHSRGDDALPNYNEGMSWPVFNGVDFSRLGNWNRWLGFFEDPAVGEFIAVYDESYDEGMVRVFSAEVTQGAKVFAFGWHESIPSANWTDDGSSYVEIHGGPSPTFDDSLTIPAGSHVQWTEIWYPVAGLGGLRHADRIAAFNLTADAQAQIAVAANRRWSGDLVLLSNRQEHWRQGVSLVPGQPFHTTVALNMAPATGRLTLRLEAPDGSLASEYTIVLD